MTIKDVTHTCGDGTVIQKKLLIADEGKVLTNDGGETWWNVKEVAEEDVHNWSEIDEPEPMADAEDYEAALAELGMEV